MKLYKGTILLVRGIPGAGKSTLADYLSGFMFQYSSDSDTASVISADEYFMVKGKYKFDRSKLHQAHIDCENRVRTAMMNEELNIFVANTFSTEKELQPYLDLAKEHNYRVFSIIVENRHGNESVHNVPKETIEKMQNRFSVKL